MSDASRHEQTHEIVIDAPIEAVWKAISDGEELTRWFVDKATVTPGVGGTISIAWGDAEMSSGTIEAWEPNKKLRKTLAPMDMGEAKHDPAVPMIDEYTIERRDGKTVLRLVCSGIPDAKEWDGFYNGTDTGWKSFLRTLRHYLEHNRGKPRTTITIVGKASVTREDAWPRLMDAGRSRAARRFRTGRPARLEMAHPAARRRRTSGTRCRRASSSTRSCRSTERARRRSKRSARMAAVAGRRARASSRPRRRKLLDAGHRQLHRRSSSNSSRAPARSRRSACSAASASTPAICSSRSSR